METHTGLRFSTWWIIVAGLLLSFVSALVPFYTAGYKLLYWVMLAGLLPYLVYGVAAPLLRGGLVLVEGLVLLGLHTWLVIAERFIGAADYSDRMIYYVPLLLALVLLPLPVMALRKPY